jgi:hypothetical protein
VRVAGKFDIPTFFIYSQDDELIPPEHFVFIQSSLKNVKEVRVLRGGHNEVRPNELLKAAGLFLRHELDVETLVKQPQNIPHFMVSDDGDEQARMYKEYSRENLSGVDIDHQMEAAAEMYYRTIPRLHGISHK